MKGRDHAPHVDDIEGRIHESALFTMHVAIGRDQTLSEDNSIVPIRR